MAVPPLSLLRGVALELLIEAHEARPRPVQAQARVCGSNAQQAADLVRGQLLELEQDQRLPVALAQTIEHAIDGARGLVALDQSQRVGPGRRDVTGALVSRSR